MACRAQGRGVVRNPCRLMRFAARFRFSARRKLRGAPIGWPVSLRARRTRFPKATPAEPTSARCSPCPCRTICARSSMPKIRSRARACNWIHSGGDRLRERLNAGSVRALNRPNGSGEARGVAAAPPPPRFSFQRRAGSTNANRAPSAKAGECAQIHRSVRSDPGSESGVERRPECARMLR